MATWGDQTCQRFEATAVGFEPGFSRMRVQGGYTVKCGLQKCCGHGAKISNYFIQKAGTMPA